MPPLTEDFESYVLDLTKRNRRLLVMLMATTAAAAIALLIFLLAQLNVDMPYFIDVALRGDSYHALNAANLAVNVAVGIAMRVWYLRDDKMTTLLTHAMVLDNEKEAAIRVLLSKKINK